MLHDLETQIRTDKVRAVKLKQSGKIEEAKSVYLGVKDLEKRYAWVQFGTPCWIR